MTDSESAKSASAADVASELSEIVVDAWRAVEDGSGGLDPIDPCDVILFLGFARAFRSFESIRLLAENEHDDDAFTLTRSLASIILRSLYVVQPEDLDEREERYIRQSWDSLSWEAKRLRALNDPSDAAYLARVEDDLAKDVEWFAANGKKPGIASDAEMARRLGLDAVYDLVYRIASSIALFSILAALGGFIGRPAEGEHFAPISLRKPEPELAENALVFAIAIYGDFLTRADKVMKPGIADPVVALIEPWLEHHPYRRSAGG